MMKRLIPFITLFISTSTLGVYAFLGIFSRMFTDDYCYSYSYDTLGLVGTLRGYYFITTFTAHRYALTFFEWLIDRFDIAGIQAMPLVFLLLWGAAIYCMMREAGRRLEWQLPRLESAALAALLLCFSIYLAPNLYQSLYWRTGILPYTAPLIAGLWLLVYLFRREDQAGITKYIVLGLGAFIASGFSEAGAVYIAVIFLLVIAASLWSLTRKDRRPWVRLGRPAVIVIAMILLALAVMYLSPVNVKRQASYQAPASIGMTFIYALQFTRDFIWLSFRTQPIPNLIFCTAAAAFALYTHPTRQSNIKTVAKGLIFTLAGTVFIIGVIHLPSAYVEKAPPADRTLILARFTLLAAELIIFYLTGLMLKQARWPVWLSEGRLKLAAVIVIAAGWFYVLRVGVNLITYDLPRYQKVAAVWDQRDRSVRSAQLAGLQVVEVQPIDSQYVGGLLELYPTPNWVNICAAQYYGVKEIHATLGW